MKKIQNDYLIRQFVGHDEYRPAMTKVSLHEGKLYATDSYSAAKIDSELCVQSYKPVEKYPDVFKVFDQHLTSEIKVVETDVLFNELMNIECCLRPIMVACGECEGGVKVCDYCDSEHECKKCKGKGEVNGPEMELVSSDYVKLFERQYLVKYIDRIIKTAKYSGVNNISIKNDQNKHRGTIFEVGDFNILLIPKYEN